MKNMFKKIGGFVSVLGVVVLAGCGARDTAKEAVTTSSDAMEKAGEAMEKTGDVMEEKTGEVMMEKADAEVKDISVSYSSPAGPETMQISLSVDVDGKISAVNSVADATHPVSLKLQNAFAAGLGDVVIGKDIAGLQVDVIGGASLTTGGFNEAVAKM